MGLCMSVGQVDVLGIIKALRLESLAHQARRRLGLARDTLHVLLQLASLVLDHVRVPSAVGVMSVSQVVALARNILSIGVRVLLLCDALSRLEHALRPLRLPLKGYGKRSSTARSPQMRLLDQLPRHPRITKLFVSTDIPARSQVILTRVIQVVLLLIEAVQSSQIIVQDFFSFLLSLLGLQLLNGGRVVEVMDLAVLG